MFGSCFRTLAVILLSGCLFLFFTPCELLFVFVFSSHQQSLGKGFPFGSFDESFESFGSPESLESFESFESFEPFGKPNWGKLLGVMANNIVRIAGRIPPEKRPDYIEDLLESIIDFQVS